MQGVGLTRSIIIQLEHIAPDICVASAIAQRFQYAWRGSEEK